MSNKTRVNRWIRDNLEALMPRGDEEEKKLELIEEDSAWVRERVMGARSGFVDRIEEADLLKSTQPQ
jgi:hypothetical protein